MINYSVNDYNEEKIDINILNAYAYTRWHIRYFPLHTIIKDLQLLQLILITNMDWPREHGMADNH